MWKSKSRAFAYIKIYDHAQNAHGLVSESIFDWFNREMAIFEEQYLSNQSELGHTILRVWKPYMRAFSYTKFCVTIPSIRWVTGKTSPDWANTVKYRYTSTSRRTSPWNTPCYLKPLWHNGCQYVRSHHSKGHLYLLSGWRDSPPNRPFYPWTSPTCDVRVTKTAITLLILVRLRWN